MSVTIRLAKFGKTNAPTYKVVAATTRTKRTGKFLDVLGYYNPSGQEKQFEINKEKFEDWKNKGAMVTNAVNKLVEGEYTYVKYNPKAKKETEEVAEEPKE